MTTRITAAKETSADKEKQTDVVFFLQVHK